jgi:branched-chain amino acid aminotransferase
MKRCYFYNMNDTLVFINHEFVPAAKASLLVSDLAIQRGYGIFDFFRTANNVPLFLEDHLQRFFRSAATMRLPVGKSPEALKTLIDELIQRNNIPEAGIRLTLTGGYSPDAYTPAEPNLIISQQPLVLPSQRDFQQGIQLVTYPHRRQLPEIKTIDYLMPIWLQPYIRQHGADDVLYELNGLVSECPRANFFIVTGDDTVVTPKDHILKGTRRKRALELAGARFKAAEQDVSLEDIRRAKEAFITSTTRNILPVVQVNGAPVGKGQPGPVTQWLGRELAADTPVLP